MALAWYIHDSKMGRSKTRSSRKTQKPHRISFPRLSTSGFLFCTIPKTVNSELKTSELSLRHFDKVRAFPTPSFPFFTILKTQNPELKTSEFSLRHYDQTPRISSSELSILHYAQKRKLGVFSKDFPNNNFFNLIVQLERPLINMILWSRSFWSIYQSYYAFWSNPEFFQLRGFVFALYLKLKTRRWKTPGVWSNGLEPELEILGVWS